MAQEYIFVMKINNAVSYDFEYYCKECGKLSGITKNIYQDVRFNSMSHYKMCLAYIMYGDTKNAVLEKLETNSNLTITEVRQLLK